MTLRARESIRPERFTFHSSRMRMKIVVREELAAMDAESDLCAALALAGMGDTKPKPSATGMEAPESPVDLPPGVDPSGGIFDC